MTYAAPVPDLLLALKAAGFDRLAALYPDADEATCRAVLEGAGAFASEVLAPIKSAADLEGCQWNDGVVTTPAGYREAYAAYAEGG